jgi:hypothetical protein
MIPPAAPFLPRSSFCDPTTNNPHTIFFYIISRMEIVGLGRSRIAVALLKTAQVKRNLGTPPLDRF